MQMEMKLRLYSWININRKFNIYDQKHDWFNVLDINYLSFLNGSLTIETGKGGS